MSRESEKQIIIDRLNNLGIFETTQNRALDGLSYDALKSLLSIEQAVRS